MDTEDNTLRLPTIAKMSIGRSRYLDVREYLRGMFLDVAKFTASRPWQPTMMSATAHLVSLLAHEEVFTTTTTDEAPMVGHVGQAVARGFSLEYFGSLVIIVMPGNNVIAIVGHRLKEATFLKEQNLDTIPVNTHLARPSRPSRACSRWVAAASQEGTEGLFLSACIMLVYTGYSTPQVAAAGHPRGSRTQARGGAPVVPAAARASATAAQADRPRPKTQQTEGTRSSCVRTPATSRWPSLGSPLRPPGRTPAR